MTVPRLGRFNVQTLREMPPEHWTHNGDSPDKIRNYYRNVIQNDPEHDPETEHFYIVLLSTRRVVMGHCLISHGTLESVQVHPREVFKPAIVASAAAIVLVHNHPSGDPTPSESDIKITRDLIRAGQLLKLEVLDHVIMGVATSERPRDYASLRELNYFYS
jgi:DNA repair protein RadC